MSQTIPTLFTRYQLSEEEELAAIQFSDTQRMYLQNIIADAAEEKVRLTFDPSKPNEFIQREAELQGIIGTLTSMLEAYGNYLDELKATHAQSSQSLI